MTADVRGNSLEVVHLFQDRLVRREGQKRVRFRSHVKKEERFRYIEEAIKKEGCEGAGMGTRREEDQGPWKQTKSRPLCLAKRHVQVDQQTSCDDRKQGGVWKKLLPLRKWMKPQSSKTSNPRCRGSSNEGAGRH